MTGGGVGKIKQADEAKGEEGGFIDAEGERPGTWGWPREKQKMLEAFTQKSASGWEQGTGEWA